jgi:hypothetical protein
MMAKPANGRPRKLWASGLPIVMASIALVVTQVAILWTRSREAELHGESTGSAARLGILSGTLWGMLLIVVLLGLVKGPAVVRERRLSARFPQAVVLTATRTRALIASLQDGTVSNVDRAESSSLPSIFTLVGTSKGLGLWTSAQSNSPYWFLEWTYISSMSVGSVDGSARSYRALMVNAEVGARQVVYPFVITGAGFAGLFEQRQRGLTEIISRLQETRAKPNVK